MASLLYRLSEFCRLERDEICHLADRAPYTYKKYYIDKKKGGKRQIAHPSKETKLLQYALLQILEPNLPPHESSYGFVRGIKSPLRANANKHVKNCYFLKTDIKDFFPSIRPNDIYVSLSRPSNPVQMVLTPEDQELVTEIFFIKGQDGSWGLPIGGVASPLLSNGAMYDLDTKLSALASEEGFVYSRYADDLVFSTDKENVSAALLRKVKKILKRQSSPNLQLNANKTVFMSKNGRVAIAGLIITPDGTISIGRKNKRRLKSLVNSYKYGSIGVKERKYLQGYLAFLLDVEPDYYNRLCHKYGAETVKSALKRP